MVWFTRIEKIPPDHLAYREWLESIINGNAAYGYSELVLSGFLRGVTHPRVFEMLSALSSGVRFVNQIREAHHAVCLAPGPMHWKIFLQCVEQIDAKGNDISLLFQGIGYHFVPYINKTYQRRGSLREGRHKPYFRIRGLFPDLHALYRDESCACRDG